MPQENRERRTKVQTVRVYKIKGRYHAHHSRYPDAEGVGLTARGAVEGAASAPEAGLDYDLAAWQRDAVIEAVADLQSRLA